MSLIPDRAARSVLLGLAPMVLPSKTQYVAHEIHVQVEMK